MTDPIPTFGPSAVVVTHHFHAASDKELTAILDHYAGEIGREAAAKFDVIREVLPDGRHAAHVTLKTA